jgi:hypothetical protein
MVFILTTVRIISVLKYAVFHFSKSRPRNLMLYICNAPRLIFGNITFDSVPTQRQAWLSGSQCRIKLEDIVIQWRVLSILYIRGSIYWSLVWECSIQHCDVILQTTCRAVFKTLRNCNISLYDFMLFAQRTVYVLRSDSFISRLVDYKIMYTIISSIVCWLYFRKSLGTSAWCNILSAYSW